MDPFDCPNCSWADWEEEMVYVKFCSFREQDVISLIAIDGIPNLITTATFSRPDGRSQFLKFLQ